MENNTEGAEDGRPADEPDAEPSSDPAAELATVQDTRARLADRIITPWWYHPAMGGLLAVLCLTLGLGSKRHAALSGLCIGGLFWLGYLYRSLTGIDLTAMSATRKNAPAPGRRSTRLIYALAGIIGIVLFACVVVPDALGWPWFPWPAAVLLFAASIALGRAYDHAIRTDLRTKAL